MIISYQWLLSYLPEPLPVADLSNILTSIGLEVEAVEAAEAIKGSLAGLVIGEVLTCEKHPNADKLKLTTVNIGSETHLRIVCGAPNVAAGQKVVVAPVGTTVFPLAGEPFEIKKAKIRGEESQGMICAEDEIGLGQSHDGVMVLPADARVGTLAKAYFNIPEPDFAIHIGLTPNRSDAMSHIGVARDVCAYLSHHNGKSYRVNLPSFELPEKTASENIIVTIQAPEACPRYTGICISGVKVGPSPEWLQLRLQTIGVRSINNVVDITNYVLHEFGQPLHAFDADKIGGKQVSVKFLPEGSSFLSLDEKERKLTAHDLMICDEKEGMCIAGVFGGAHSGVTDTTGNVFLESAYFDPTHIRRTSVYHGLRTDAATHFEKGVDMSNVIPALKRAAALICELAGGKIASEVIDVYPQPLKPVTVEVSLNYIHKLSGKQYSKETVYEILQALGFAIEAGAQDDMITVLVPSNKTDVAQPADIVEEILRIDGLDNIAIPERLNISLKSGKQMNRELREKIAETLCGAGFQEIVTNSIVNSKYYPERTDLVRMLNSLSSELDVMRPSMLESGLEVIAYNCNRKNNNLFLFEFGNVYTATESRYAEAPRLALWATGHVNPQHWNQPAKAVDVFYLKGILQHLLSRSGIRQVNPSYAEGTVTYKYKNEALCTLQSVPQQQRENFGIKQDVFFMEIRWDIWQKAMTARQIKYAEVPRFPAVQRDLAIVLDKNVTYQQVLDATKGLKIQALQDFDLFDVFESEKLGQDKKSYALSYTFQLTDRTLTDAEIDQLMQQLIQTYQTKLQAQIRN